MSVNQELAGFIKATFRSIWSLELLLLLKTQPDRRWSRAEIVSSLRGSESVVTQSVGSLVAAGLVAVEEDGETRYCYLPASADIGRLAEATQKLYAKRPDAVRRLIVMSANEGLTAFADAFRLRKD